MAGYHREIITDTDLRWLCKYNTENEDKLICRKYLEDGEVTTDLLKIYVETEIETWGDMIKGLIEFKYENTIIVGRYNNGDYPAEILSITNKSLDKKD
jgi:hypothetical protein